MIDSQVPPFDLTPDPRVLIALTHTPLQPLDALCELIDNAIDSFYAADLAGTPVQFPLVAVEIPGRTEVERRSGAVRVRDNGPGLSAEQARNALRAGFSGNNQFDTLGLFGMGFNVSTGKIGSLTRFLTARSSDTSALEVTVDLVEMQARHDYAAPAKAVARPADLAHGTIVEISGWWPDGNSNSGFIRKLASYSKPTIRKELGRRYGTLLRENKIRLLVNGEPCEPFEHCVWSRERFVERKEHGRIPARFDFDHVLTHQTWCMDCGVLVPAGATICEACNAAHLRTIEERVRGWVGVQRFDDQTFFGIDLIRNGRAIRIAERSAFFDFVDEFKKTVKDYPIDNPFGRIVGEVHLNHVPVDFLKQDFQRSSEQWQRAIVYLRGDSSLQPNQPNAEHNRSPIFKLYQGYRRVRTPGRADMYMGYWETGRPKRISRDKEREYYQKFLDKIPGYYDDAEWWRQVEQADRRPVDELIKCPNCQAENLKGAEECLVCGSVLIGQECINSECARLLPRSAVSCPYCGTSQVVEVRDPWRCAVCESVNVPDSDICATCSSPKGTLSPSSREALQQLANLNDELSVKGCSVLLADGTHSQPVDVLVYGVGVPMSGHWKGPRVPLIAHRGETLDLFVDLTHPVFTDYHVRPHVLIASEVAQYIHLMNGRLQAQHGSEHSVSNLSWEILERCWSEVLEDSPERVKDDARTLFEAIRQSLVSTVGHAAANFFSQLSEAQTSAFVENVISRGIDVAQISTLRESGRYVAYLDESALVDLYRQEPHLFMDGNVWRDTFADMGGLPEAVAREVQLKIRTSYLNCLQDVAAYVRYEIPEALITQRARAAVDYLSSRLAG